MARVLLLVSFVLWPALAGAMHDLEVEQDVADLLAAPTCRQEEEAAPRDVSNRLWAVLPQVGYGPDTGPVAGVKFSHRDLFGSGVTFDLDGTYALNLQQRLVLSVGWPHGLDDRLLVLFRARWDRDPTFEFFGLGNNDVGPDPASTHLIERGGGTLLVGWRPTEHLAINAGMGLAHVHIGRGEQDDMHTPFTVDRFPQLAGIDGGFVNPLELALVWNTRDGIVHPTTGWRGILKVAHTDHALLSDFEFTRYVADLSRTFSWKSGRHVVAARLGGAYIDGPRREIPFWELEELGGDDSLRGFFPYRFLGQSRVLGNLEYRGCLTDFDFYHLWHVRLDGVIFGEAGRVFLSGHELKNEFQLNDNLLSRVVGNLQYSYGPGLRIALSEALVARLDVGFSNEEQGLVYLAFGQTF